MKRIVIAGSGKMAKSIGDWLLEEGHQLLFVTECGAQLDHLEKMIARKRRQLLRLFPDNTPALRCDCAMLNHLGQIEADIILETTSEEIGKKRAMVSTLMGHTQGSPMVWSNSSSFLPEEIWPGCVTTHMFYPPALTRIVELIYPEDCSDEIRRETENFFSRADWCVLVQQHDSPYLVNRLLLSLQCGCFEALMRGQPAESVDEASTLGVFPMGQLRMMDAIGLDVMAAAVQRYATYPSLGEVDFKLMAGALVQLTELGKSGRKNGDGLLGGQPLPWPPAEVQLNRDRLEESLKWRIRGSLQQIVGEGLLNLKQVREIGERVFFADDLASFLRE